MSHSSSTRSSQDVNIQYKQKILHYRSELKKLTSTIEKKDKILQEQKDTITFLKEKLSEAPQEHLIQSSHSQTLTELSISSFFSYSIMIPKDDDQISVKGHFIIKNKGMLPVHEPLICLVVNQPQAIHLSGKINHPKQRKLNDYLVDNEELYQSWDFIENHSLKEARKSGKYWLKPTDFPVLNANDVLSFSDFELEIRRQKEGVTFSIDGFIYGQEIPDGLSADNQIIGNLF
ncbi:hypothetical protein BTS2_3758 [Bacillus sp. TS-2]|nr:hypothetical protein BTS2_3758 [Bacillus sp. TS-2]